MSSLKKNYTKVPNEILEENQLSLSARLLYIVLLRYCGNRECCYPRQNTLARHLGISTRQVRNRLKELSNIGLIFILRKGFNMPNTYKVSVALIRSLNKNSNSYHIGSAVPLHTSQEVPPNSTYIKRTVNISKDNFEEKRKKLANKMSVNLPINRQ